MRTILHIVTRHDAELARTVIGGQRALAETQVEVVELSFDPPPDYGALVEKIFNADSIEVW